MARKLTVTLDLTRYRAPEQSDIDEAKSFVLDRNEASRALASAIDGVLDRMAEQMAVICYRYGIDPKRFTLSDAYSPGMMAEISDAMDQVEDDITALIDDFSTRVTEDGDRRIALLAWMALLGRGNRNLRDTLHGYLTKTMRDFGAALAALAYAGRDLPHAVSSLRTYKHQIWNMPEMKGAFRLSGEFEDALIRSHGVTEGARGISSSGASNVTQMARTTLDMAWMRSLRLDFEEGGAAGYYVARGSSYPCPLCDSMCGFHTMDDTEGFPPYHARCCCFVFPIYPTDKED